MKHTIEDINYIIRKSRKTLNDSEKEYLEAVLRPFKNRVKCIQKTNIGKDYTFIRIFVECYMPEEATEYISLPFFDGTKMYTGMERDKDYTLDELGLFQEDNHVTDQ